MLCEKCMRREATYQMCLCLATRGDRRSEVDFYRGPHVCQRCKLETKIDEVIDWKAWEATGLPGNPRLVGRRLGLTRKASRFNEVALR